MIEAIDTSLVDWSRAQFALTAIYHWIFVPLTLGLGVIQAIMETIYVKTGNVFWKNTAKFWMKLFGINFAVGVATGLILEFEFGTNWSNYSWFVGDIFGAPLAIEGIFAFFMEATFIAVMYFGWEKVSKRFHLAATWLTIFGATVSALWILIANAWMQYPAGMHFNPDSVRNEMLDFWAVAGSPVAINKFFHTVLSGWIVGSVFVLGISSWYLIKKKSRDFALASIRIASIFGIVASILIITTGDKSAYHVAQKQPMKLAAMEGLYQGQEGTGLIGIGVLNPKFEGFEKYIPGEEGIDTQKPVIYKIEFPKMLSFLAERDLNAFVPGVRDLLDGGYTLKNGEVALSAQEKIDRGKRAIQALADYRIARKEGNDSLALAHKATLDENFPYFGYGYINSPEELVPPVGLVFYSFRLMVILGAFFVALFVTSLFLDYRKKLDKIKWFQWVAFLSIPLAYLASQLGWVVAEVGRQPWAIQDVLPVGAAVSKLQTSSVQITFFIFLSLFTILLIAEIGIMIKAIKKGPEMGDSSQSIKY